MTERELVDEFLKFETENDLFDWTIENVRVWQYARYLTLSIFKSAFRKNNNSMLPPIHKPYNEKISISVLFDRFILCNVNFRGRKDVLLVSHSRKVKAHGNSYRDLYTYWLDKELNYTHIVLDKNAKDGDYVLQDSHNIITHDFTSFCQKKHISPRISCFGKFELQERIISPLERILGLELEVSDKNKIMDNFLYILEKINAYREYYSYILTKINPRIILMPVGYSLTNQFLTSVAHERGIPVVELQHGAVTDVHIAYNYPENVKLDGFPDYFFSFGNFDIGTARWPIDLSHVIPVGYPELEMYVSKYQCSKSTKKTIVFISSQYRVLDDIARQLYNALDKNAYHIIYKLHPKEMRDWKTVVSSKLLNTSIEIVHSLDKSLYECLGEADWVVGMSSTALYEATAFDCKIAIVDHVFSAFSAPLYEQGKAILVKNVDELINQILSDSFIPNSKVSFFENNSICKIENAVKCIIEE